MSKHWFVAAMLALASLGTFSGRASGATEQEEARFAAAVRKEVADRDADGLAKLTCWDGVTPKAKASATAAYATLLGTADVTLEVRLVEVDRKLLRRDLKMDGVVHRWNLPATKQVDVRILDKDKKVLGIIGLPVGEKGGSLLLTVWVPAE